MSEPSKDLPIEAIVLLALAAIHFGLPVIRHDMEAAGVSGGVTAAMTATVWVIFLGCTGVWLYRRLRRP